MKISLNWIKQYANIDVPIDKLVEKIGAQLGAVEEVAELGRLYDGIVVAKVISSEKHPNADKLSVCMIDAGNAKPVQVVCGAPNVAAGQTVAWIPPGATVPSTADKDPFVLEAKELRGVTSNGMIASAKELGLGDDHTGILVLDDSGKAGEPLAKALGLDDHIIDIENKMFTHRPDCFGMLGVAREIAGIQQKRFKSPAWYRADANLLNDGRKNVLKLQVKNELPKLVPRFCAVAIKDVKVGPSPAWLQSYLARVGIRPINNIVDVTNYVMLETGQPLHAYDYDKVGSAMLGVRLSKTGESLKLLGGKQLKLEPGAVVITDGKKPIGLGGVMGGTETEVGEATANIILEAATFDMNLTRKTAMAYGLFTDAATRFTKSQSPLQNLAAMVRATELIREVAGGRVASPIVDKTAAIKPAVSVEVSTDFINSRLGIDLTGNEITRLLENVEFKVTGTNGRLKVLPPFWRMDIHIPEDVVEEVGRLYGYQHLPMVLPDRLIEPTRIQPVIALKAQLRDALVRAGANETLTYSFVNGRLMEAVGQNPKDAYHIRNSLSPDLQYYRLGLMPSLLEKIQPNLKAGYDDFALFEIGKGHIKGKLDDEKLPKELERLNLVIASKRGRAGAAYFAAKHLLDYLLAELGIDATYEPLGDPGSKTATYYEPHRSAKVVYDGEKIGRVGEFKQSVTTALKLPKYCAGFSLDLEKLLTARHEAVYQPLNKYPDTEQDICLRTSAEKDYQQLTDFLSSTLSTLSKPHGYRSSITPVDIYQKDKDRKQTTWRIRLWHPERTLTTAEVNKLLDELAKQAKTKLNAERI